MVENFKYKYNKYKKLNYKKWNIIIFILCHWFLIIWIVNALTNELFDIIPSYEAIF